MNHDEVLFQKRIEDLAKAAYSRGIPVFTDFLTMNERSLLHTMSGKLPGIRVETYGGYEYAERQMAVLVSDALFLIPFSDYPITQLKIESKHKKFAEPLSHRDYLGAILGLGIDRGKLGDILVMEHAAYVFCSTKLQEFLQQELTKVRNTQVQVFVSDQSIQMEQHCQLLKGTVASLRADAVLAMVYKLSRNRAAALFQAEKVFVNGRLTKSSSHLLKEGDLVSVRGYGRFQFQELLSVTKKERYCIQVQCPAVGTSG